MVFLEKKRRTWSLLSGPREDRLPGVKDASESRMPALQPTEDTGLPRWPKEVGPEKPFPNNLSWKSMSGNLPPSLPLSA